MGTKQSTKKMSEREADKCREASLNTCILNRDHTLLSQFLSSINVGDLCGGESTCLELAAARGDHVAVFLLLMHGARPTPSSCEKLPELGSADKTVGAIHDCPSHYPRAHLVAEFAEQALRSSPELGPFLLRFPQVARSAVAWGMESVLEEFVQNGDRQALLLLAVENADHKLARRLIDLGARVLDPRRLAIALAKGGSRECLRICREAHAMARVAPSTLDAKQPTGRSPLWLAVYHNDHAAVQFILETRGADALPEDLPLHRCGVRTRTLFARYAAPGVESISEATEFARGRESADPDTTRIHLPPRKGPA